MLNATNLRGSLWILFLILFLIPERDVLASPSTLGLKLPLEAWVTLPTGYFRTWPTLPEPPEYVTDAMSLDLIAAKGEFETAAFVLRSTDDINELIIKLPTLKSKSGEEMSPDTMTVRTVIPATHDSYRDRFADRDPTPILLAPPQLAGAFAIRANRLKEFHLTVSVPKKTPADIYQGTITFCAEGQKIGEMQITLRVLPFSLPKPRTRDNPEKPFSIIIDMPGESFGVLAEHGATHTVAHDITAEIVNTMSNAGLDTASLWTANTNIASLKCLKESHKIFLLAPPDKEILEKISSTGLNAVTTADPDEIYTRLAPFTAACIHTSLPEPHLIRRWHTLSSSILLSAEKLSCDKNPWLWRRKLGFAAYYGHADGIFIPFSKAMALRVKEKNITCDTLAFEGLREAVDDIRYVALLDELARECIKSRQNLIAVEGRRALHLSEQIARELDAGCDTARLEITAQILRLRTLLQTTEAEYK